MSQLLDVHPASPDELAAAHRNVFDIWSKGLSLEEHLRYRLDQSPSHSRAGWYVGTLDDRVVVSLGAYPVMFRIGNEDLPGIAIGSVYTVGDFRGRGFAPQLIKYVEDHYRGAGTVLSALYSDIKPEYYARLGYTLCPALSGWRDVSDVPLPGAIKYRLVPIAPQTHLPALMKMYADYHGATPLSIARDLEYWKMILQKAPDDRFYALEAADGSWAGYVRVGIKGRDWRITDFALIDPSDTLARSLYATLIALARAEGGDRLGGWLPDSAAAKNYFEMAPRSVEITMIKPLAWKGTLTSEMIAATGQFCEIDHV